MESPIWFTYSRSSMGLIRSGDRVTRIMLARVLIDCRLTKPAGGKQPVFVDGAVIVHQQDGKAGLDGTVLIGIVQQDHIEWGS